MRAGKLSVFVLAMLLAAPLLAQGDDLGAWLSVGVDKRIAKGLSADIEAEYRLQDHLHQTDRWAVGASLSYRLYRNKAKTFDVKADAGAKLMRLYVPENMVMKDSVFVWDELLDNDVFKGQEYNTDDAYTVSKFRATASVSASVEAGRFKISLRERYQYTGNDSVAVTERKWRYSAKDGQVAERPDKADTEWKATNNRRHVLRSRLQLDYNIPNCKVDPYVSAELFNDLKDGLSLQKIRYLGGLEYKLNKVHQFKFYYAYQHNSDDDEPGGHIVGLSYGYSF